ncbi:MAG: thermostable hemolysin [Pseudomonas sp.]|nr:thermostable hemolysin [Pseudomonas sp.]
MELPWVYSDTALAQIGREQPFNLYLANRQSPRRAAIEAFISERFAVHHRAHIRHFMPSLLSLEDGSGQLLGAVGLRSAAGAPLFLERYLQQPVEQVITAKQGAQAAQRAQLVEVGNLAAASPGAARLLIVALTDLLVALGYRWVCFTGTLALLNSFQRLGLTPVALGAANPECLGDEQADWGTYYDNQPQVMAGDIYAGHQRLLQQGAYPRLAHQAFYALEDMPHVACS